MNGRLPNSEIHSLPYCRQNLRFEHRLVVGPDVRSRWFLTVLTAQGPFAGLPPFDIQSCGCAVTSYTGLGIPRTR